MTAAVFSPPGLVPQLTRSWVRAYSVGMSESVRATRLLEIESDLWEHFADRQAEGASPAMTNIDMFGRLLRGVPSDIAWRFQAEGLHMNIHFPIERIAGIFLLFLIIPFIAGVSISGYDPGQGEWPSEFARFSEMSERSREITALLHGAIGLLLIGGAAQLLAMLRDRSPRLVTVGATLLMAAGVIMLINAALYRAMSGLADEYLVSGDQSLVATARGFILAIEALSMANSATMSAGILAMSIALTRTQMVPRWTAILPVGGVAATLFWVTLGQAAGDATWFVVMLGFLCVALWLVICGGWLLFGGSRRQPDVSTLAASAV